MTATTVRRQIRDAGNSRSLRQVAAAVVLDPPTHGDPLRTSDVLRCAPQLGQVRVALLARHASPSMTACAT